MFAKTKDASKNQILVILHLVALELIVWLMLLEMPFAGNENFFDPLTCARNKYMLVRLKDLLLMIYLQMR